MTTLALMDAVIAMRYHSAVIGIAAGLRAVVVKDTPKMQKLAADFELSSFCTMDSIDDINASIVGAKTAPNPWVPSTHVNKVRECMSIKRFTTPIVRQFKPPSLQDALAMLGPKLAKDAGLICHVLDGDVGSKHRYGLEHNMLDPEFNLEDACRYILGDSDSNFKPSLDSSTYYPLTSNRRNYWIDFDENLTLAFRTHRSGWPYVVSGLMQMHAGRHHRQPDIYFDLYSDRTFHWGSSAYKALGLLPRKTPWIGIVHHTFDQRDFHNSVELFKKKNFLESLDSCFGLCALSKYLADQIREKLSEINVNIPVHVLYHPTEVEVPRWSLKAFLEGPRLLVQVGSWMRDETRFESLDLGANLLGLFKMRVGGKRHPELKVPLFPRLNDEEYDLLLTRSVVFLALRDCSAANTILECKARGTPLIINRHEAVVEALGPDYPGYYNTLEEARTKLNTIDILQACNRHLMAPGLLRDRLNLDYFVDQVSTLVSSLNLKHDDPQKTGDNQ
jgi:hypothetical protein